MIASAEDNDANLHEQNQIQVKTSVPKSAKTHRASSAAKPDCFAPLSVVPHHGCTNPSARCMSRRTDTLAPIVPLPLGRRFGWLALVVMAACMAAHYAHAVDIPPPIKISAGLLDRAGVVHLTAGRETTIALQPAGSASVALLIDGQKVTSTVAVDAPLKWTPTRFGATRLEFLITTNTTVWTSTFQAVVTLNDWRWIQPAPVGADLRDAVRAGDRWCVVGDAGTVFLCNAAGAFKPVYLHTAQRFNAVAYADGRYMLGGDDHDPLLRQPSETVWTSVDALHWEPMSNSPPTSVNDIIFANRKWVSVGNGGAIYHWLGTGGWQKLPTPTTADLRAITYAAGSWVAVGDAILTSTDGVVWTVRTGPSNLTSVAYGNSRWVVASVRAGFFSSSVWQSSDLATWTYAASANGPQRAVAFIYDRFITGPNGGILYSVDGLNWKAESDPDFYVRPNAIVSDGPAAIMVAPGGDMRFSSDGGRHWTRFNPLTVQHPREITALAYGEGKFVGSRGYLNGAIQMISSADGTNWLSSEVAVARTALAYPNEKISSITHRAGTFVAAGYNLLLTSADGETWIKRDPIERDAYISVVSSPSVYVALARPRLYYLPSSIYTSDDGITWTKRASGLPNAMKEVKHGGPQGFVLVGTGGRIMTSPDGVSWTPRTSNTTWPLFHVAWSSDVGYLVTSGSVLLRSTDGVTWMTVDLPGASASAIVTTPHGALMVAGDGALYSGNGIDWVAGPMPVPVDGFALGPSALLGFDGSRSPRSMLMHSLVAPASSGVSAVRMSPGEALQLLSARGGDVQWQHNGRNVGPGATTYFRVLDLQPANAGIYNAWSPEGGRFDTTIVGLVPKAKVAGGGAAEVGSDIRHPNGNTFDQVQLDSAAATIIADPGQITRVSFLDLTDDIVQVEFSGAGSLSLVLDSPSGPSPAIRYNQPGVVYMKGHAGIVITGADATTNVSVFSVGRTTAVNQALFRDDVSYDGVADIAFIAISSVDGKFGGVRAANASYFATKGHTGILAPDVEFGGPVFVADVHAAESATAVLRLGRAADIRVTGGDLFQGNQQPVQVSGFAQLRFTDGSTSAGRLLPANACRGRLVLNGSDVTDQIVVNP